MLSPTACCACGSQVLRPHLRTAAPVVDEGFAPSTTAFGSALGDIVRCASCGHMQLDVMPTEVVLGEVYGAAADEEYVSEQAGQRATAGRLLERVEQHVRPGRLLDLGCWVGFLLAEARDRGWQGTGVEPSSWAASHAREELGLDVVRGDVTDAPLPEGEFSAVVMADVLEHLLDPGAALDRVARLLAPGGVLVLVLPDAGSRVARVLGARWWSVIPTHVQYFTRRSCVGLLERSGWRVLETATAPKVFSLGYYLQRLNGYSRPLATAVTRAAGAVGQQERLIAPDFRDRMLVIAARPGAPAPEPDGQPGAPPAG